MPLEYISLKEAAAKWRTKPWYIAKACEAGQVPGAAKLGETWIIPADLERPKREGECFYIFLHICLEHLYSDSQ